MNVVYFSDELTERAPEVVTSLYEECTGLPVLMEEIIGCVMRREPVSIRSATEAELVNLDTYVSIYEILKMLGSHLQDTVESDLANSSDKQHGLTFPKPFNI